MKRTTQLFVTLLVIATVGGLTVVAANGIGGAQTLQQTDGDTASVTIEDQDSEGEVIVVDSVTLSEGGFVVIHDSSLGQGEAVGSVIGVSRYLEAGTHEDVPITLARELETGASHPVTAMAHRDTNGNGGFDFVVSDGEVDGAYTTGGAAETEAPETETETTTETPEMNETTTEAAGQVDQETETETETEATPNGQEAAAVTDTATINTGPDAVQTMTLDVSNQSGDGSSIAVDRVTLFQGGYVVVHDSSLQSDPAGSVVGASRYLQPGTYSDLEIDLAQPIDFGGADNVTVTVMSHRESNGNLAFDYVVGGGSTDGPYLEDGEAVSAQVVLTSEGAETPTATETPETNETTTEAGG